VKCLNSKATCVFLFTGAALSLFLYELSISWQYSLPVILFWIDIVLMLGVIIYQSLKIGLSSSYIKVVLLEIVITGILFHLIYQIPYYGLVGTDAYRDLASSKGIFLSGHVLGAPSFIVNEYSYYPTVHIFGAELSLVSGIDLFSVAKWIPSFIDISLIILVYLTIREFYKEERVALLATLVFVSLANHICFSSLFIRETYGLILAICCVYLYFSARHSQYPITKYVLAFICLILTIFTHHLTSFLLLLFFSIHFLLTKLTEIPSFKRFYFRDNISGAKVSILFIFTGYVVLLAFWMYLIFSPITTLVSLVNSLISPSQWGSNSYSQMVGLGSLTFRGQIIVNGFYFFILIFSIILLYGLLTRANNRTEAYSSTLFLFACGSIGFLSLYLISSAVIPDRFLTYGWLFGFAPVFLAILRFKHKLLKNTGIFLIIAFMLFNIYTIDPPYWDSQVQRSSTTGSIVEFTIANRFNFSSGNIVGPQGIEYAIYTVHNNLGVPFSVSETNLTKFNWVIINREMLESERTYYQLLNVSEGEKLLPLNSLVNGDSSNFNKIFDSDSYSIYKLIK
jgi:hypothetical protein